MGNDLQKKYNEAWERVELIKNNEGKYEAYMQNYEIGEGRYNIPYYQNALGQPYHNLFRLSSGIEILRYEYFDYITGLEHKIAKAYTDGKNQAKIIQYLQAKENYCISQNNVADIADYLLIMNRHIKPIIKFLTHFTFKDVAEDIYENPRYAYGSQGDWIRAKALSERTKALLKKYEKLKFNTDVCTKFAADLCEWLNTIITVDKIDRYQPPGINFIETITNLYHSLNAKLTEFKTNHVSDPNDPFEKIANMLDTFDKNYELNKNNKKGGGLFSLDSENSISIIISAIIIFIIVIAIITLIYVLLNETGIISNNVRHIKTYAT